MYISTPATWVGAHSLKNGVLFIAVSALTLSLYIEPSVNSSLGSSHTQLSASPKRPNQSTVQMKKFTLKLQRLTDLKV